jgi:hypothetical protein
VPILIAMGSRSDALELARFMAFDGRNADEIARTLQSDFAMCERDATRLALNVVTPPPEEPSIPGQMFGL